MSYYIWNGNFIFAFNCPVNGLYLVSLWLLVSGSIQPKATVHAGKQELFFDLHIHDNKITIFKGNLLNEGH